MRYTGDRRTGQLLGVQLVGHLGSEIAKRIDIPATAIFNRMTVDAISDLDLSYTPPLGSPWDALQYGRPSMDSRGPWTGSPLIGTTLPGRAPIQPRRIPQVEDRRLPLDEAVRKRWAPKSRSWSGRSSRASPASRSDVALGLAFAELELNQPVAAPPAEAPPVAVSRVAIGRATAGHPQTCVSAGCPLRAPG